MTPSALVSRTGPAAGVVRFAPYPGAQRAGRVVVAIIFACAFQNFVLAIINANIIPVTEQVVTVVQFTLTLAALLVGLLRTNGLAPGFYWAIYAFVFLFGIATWRRGDADLRFLYDVSVIPVFILLGSVLPRFPLKAVMILFAIVATVTGIELLLPDLYAQVINPLGYYIGTRDWVGGQFETIDVDGTGLYVGAQRPGGTTFLNFLSDHRLGSIFMEPLSLGYFAVIASLVVNYFYARRLVRYSLLLLCVLVAALADSRISVFCVVVIALLWPLARRVPGQLAFLPPLAALAALIVVAAASGGAVGPEELAGRLSITVDAIQNASAPDVLFGGFYADLSGDSAIVAIVSNAGLFAVPILLALYSGLFSARRPENALHWGAFLYVLIASLFGGALFSIKTAPLLGALIGYVSAHPREEAPRA